MGRGLLFTGDKAVGKSTALRRVVQIVGPERFSGFLCDELRQDGERTGFRISTLDGQEGILASVESESELRVGGLDAMGRPRYGVELGFLENVAIPSIIAVLEKPDDRIIVIDEIGPMQLFSEVFKSTVLEALISTKLILGTIVLRSIPWVDSLKDRDDVETFLLTKQNRETLAEMMCLYLGHHVAD